MKYENEMLKAIHQDAKAMCKVGAITKEKLSEFDEMCLKNPPNKKQKSSVCADDNSVKIKIAGHATA